MDSEIAFDAENPHLFAFWWLSVDTGMWIAGVQVELAEWRRLANTIR